MGVALVLSGHTYLSRVHTKVQCMTVCKETVDGTKIAKCIHADWHATAPVKNPPSPRHSMLTRTAAQDARVSEQRKLRKNQLQRAHANIEHRGTGVVLSLCVQSEMQFLMQFTRARILCELFSINRQNIAWLSFKILRGSVWVACVGSVPRCRSLLVWRQKRKPSPGTRTIARLHPQ